MFNLTKKLPKSLKSIIWVKRTQFCKENVAETLLHQFKHPQVCTCKKNLNFLGERTDGWTGRKQYTPPTTLLWGDNKRDNCHTFILDTSSDKQSLGNFTDKWDQFYRTPLSSNLSKYLINFIVINLVIIFSF